MSNKKQSNTIIEDWLEKYGDPEIDKKVEERLEQITKEIMSNKKQSSIEWLIEKLDQNFDYVAYTLIEQAKAMHQQEIEEAYDREVIGDIQNWYIRNGKHYYELHYNETSIKQDNE